LACKGRKKRKVCIEIFSAIKNWDKNGFVKTKVSEIKKGLMPQAVTVFQIELYPGIMG